jgi:ligand-binding SRPBCC domain-containing protein
MNPCFAWGATTHELTRTQWLPQSPQELFPFFENPNSLATITPGWLGFRVISSSTDEICKDTQIVYTIRWLGLSVRWRTLIESWTPNREFVDTQLNGPYILWHHTHTFEPSGAGTLMTDRAKYRLPFGPLGEIMHHLLVRRQLEEIFDYRARAVAERFSGGRVFSAPEHGKVS